MLEKWFVISEVFMQLEKELVRVFKNQIWTDNDLHVLWIENCLEIGMKFITLRNSLVWVSCPGSKTIDPSCWASTLRFYIAKRRNGDFWSVKRKLGPIGPNQNKFEKVDKLWPVYNPPSVSNRSTPQESVSPFILKSNFYFNLGGGRRRTLIISRSVMIIDYLTVIEMKLWLKLKSLI